MFEIHFERRTLHRSTQGEKAPSVITAVGVGADVAAYVIKGGASSESTSEVTPADELERARLQTKHHLNDED